MVTNVIMHCHLKAFASPDSGNTNAPVVTARCGLPCKSRLWLPPCAGMSLSRSSERPCVGSHMLSRIHFKILYNSTSRITLRRP